jgi:hypothetical protein
MFRVIVHDHQRVTACRYFTISDQANADLAKVISCDLVLTVKEIIVCFQSLLVFPSAVVTSPPDISDHEPSIDRSDRTKQDIPLVPY